MDRTAAPEYQQIKDLKLVLPEKITLQNGVELFWLKDVKDESVKLEINWRAGTKYGDKTLAANFANKLLMSGSETYKADQIAQDIDFFGGYVQPELDKDHAGITIYGLRDTIGNIFDIFSKALQIAAFPKSELEKELSISFNKFKIEMQKDKFVARRSFTEHVFGPNSKYSNLVNENSFKELTRQDVLDFYSEFYKKTPVLFLTGNADKSFIERLKNWSGDFSDTIPAEQVQSFNQTTGEINIERKDAVQVAIRIGRLMFKKNHPDYFKFQVLNTILGGYFGSRLMANLREERGFTYGIGSGMAVLEDAGYFFISTEVKKEEFAEAVKQISIELQRLKAELISEDELIKVKNYMLGEFLRQADGPSSMMEIHKNFYFNQLPTSYYSDFIQAILNVTAKELMEVAKKYLVAEKMVNVTVGT